MSETRELFGPESVESKKPGATKAETPGAPRLIQAERRQVVLRPCCLEDLLAPDHEARAIWRIVEGLDLSGFHSPIKAREGVCGRDATDPKVLIALWLYATATGVGSARELDRLCKTHDAFRWICGGVPLNYHTLSDFRVEHAAALDELFTQVLAAMMSQDLVTLTRTAQDGSRVRASAGAASFRREPRLQELLKAAEEQVEYVKRLADDPSAVARETAAKARAAKDHEERIKKAIEELPKVRAAKKTAEEKTEARVSTTDPEARVMKMGDGGFRPAYNIQFATTTEEKVIVGVGVTNIGSDKSEMGRMLDQIEERTGARPDEHLVDGGFVKLDEIEQAAKKGTTVFAPEPAKKSGSPPNVPVPGDAEEVAAWRERMGTPEAKEIYKERAATAELVNADLKEHRGMTKLRVRGLAKVTTMAVWWALTYNILKWISVSA